MINTVWARIPHIYGTPFYVYQYATCFVSSAKLHKDFVSATGVEKDRVRDRYLNLLKSGGNDYPMELLKKAGVDLTQKESFMAVVEQLDDLVNKLEVEVNKISK